jgi:quinol---cytochrome c reductase iron-sulfur subunit, bacillus type
MARSLNPNSAGHSAPPAARPADPPRRSVLAGLAAVVIGGLISLFPLGAGALVFLDPILKRKPKAGGEGAKEEGRPFRRVATVEALPADGTPVQVPVIADLTDAWSREPNQPIGAVYLRKLADNKVECFNAICPHAGCFVAYSGDRKVFQCPCHTSSFELDGKRILPSPSPRDMDGLAIDEEKLKKEGEVWVQFVNYYPGHEEREAKP